MSWHFVQLVLVGIGIIVFIIVEILDWQGRAEIIEKKFPRVWRFMDARPTRVVLLVVAVAFFG